VPLEQADQVVTPSRDVSSNTVAVNLHARVLKSTQILTSSPSTTRGEGNHFNKLFACRGRTKEYITRRLKLVDAILP
jgi:hypothetical protein